MDAFGKPIKNRNKFNIQTPFSLYLNITAKKIHFAKPLAFPLHFVLWRIQNHHFNLTSKIMNV